MGDFCRVKFSLWGLESVIVCPEHAYSSLLSTFWWVNFVLGLSVTKIPKIKPNENFSLYITYFYIIDVYHTICYSLYSGSRFKVQWTLTCVTSSVCHIEAAISGVRANAASVSSTSALSSLGTGQPTNPNSDATGSHAWLSYITIRAESSWGVGGQGDNQSDYRQTNQSD